MLSTIFKSAIAVLLTNNLYASTVTCSIDFHKTCNDKKCEDAPKNYYQFTFNSKNNKLIKALRCNGIDELKKHGDLFQRCESTNDISTEFEVVGTAKDYSSEKFGLYLVSSKNASTLRGVQSFFIGKKIFSYTENMLTSCCGIQIYIGTGTCEGF
jgi:hypothetical protein